MVAHGFRHQSGFARDPRMPHSHLLLLTVFEFAILDGLQSIQQSPACRHSKELFVDLCPLENQLLAPTSLHYRQ
jgi:hypothetical protein